MIRTVLSIGFIFVLVAANPAQSQPDAYSPPDGNCSVRFPGKPKVATQTTKSALGDLKVFTATYANSDGSTYMISYTDFPPEAAKLDSRDTLYEGVREGLKGKDGKVLAESNKEIGSLKLAGREFDIERDKGKSRIRFRVVLHDGRLYQVAVIGSAKFVDGKDAKSFIDSFEIAK